MKRGLGLSRSVEVPRRRAFFKKLPLSRWMDPLDLSRPLTRMPNILQGHIFGLQTYSIESSFDFSLFACMLDIETWGSMVRLSRGQLDAKDTVATTQKLDTDMKVFCEKFANDEADGMLNIAILRVPKYAKQGSNAKLFLENQVYDMQQGNSLLMEETPEKQPALRLVTCLRENVEAFLKAVEGALDSSGERTLRWVPLAIVLEHKQEVSCKTEYCVALRDPLSETYCILNQ